MWFFIWWGRKRVYRIWTNLYPENFANPNWIYIRWIRLKRFYKHWAIKVLQLRMFDGDAWRNLIKVYQVLEKTSSMTDRLSECNYTVLTLEHLLIFNRMVNLKTIMDPTRAPHLLMTSCEIIQMFNYECKGILGGLFKTLT